MNLIITLFALISTVFSLSLEGSHIQKPFVIIVPSYNNKEWYEKNLDSLLSQKYENFRIIYINDQSKDGTGEFVASYLRENEFDYQELLFDDEGERDIKAVTEKFCKEVNRSPHFVTLINNKKRSGALANLYRTILSCKDEEIIVTVDGDDWLYNDLVLERLNEAYASNNVWFTHGNMMEYPWGHVSWCEAVPPAIIASNQFRSFKCPSHLRTFYAWLFKKIDINDLLYQGDFFAMTWDMAIMYPLAEMSGDRHAFISYVTYVYNMTNPINDNKVDAQLQNDCDALIRGKKPYEKLDESQIPDFLKEVS